MENHRGTSDNFSKWTLCLAPMMKKTDRHFRFLAKLISPNIRLFTEMIPAHAIMYGNRKQLQFSNEEKPLVLQLGTGSPTDIHQTMKIPEVLGFDEINLNCGCPSPTVQSGNFGVKLMLNPKATQECVRTLRQQIPDHIPVSIKIRLGVDSLYSYSYLSDYVGMAIQAGASIIFVHARKALLKINPKKNREVPDLNYDWVYRLKNDFKDTQIVINGGIKQAEESKIHLSKVDGIMLGRVAYQNPMALSDFENKIFNRKKSLKLRPFIVEKYLDYTEKQLNLGQNQRKLVLNLLNIFSGQKRAKEWRMLLNEQSKAERISLEQISNKALEIHMTNSL